MLTNLVMAPPVIIFQMGKVGSESIFYSLKESKAPNPVFHVHFLSQKGIRQAEEYYRKHSNVRFPNHLHASRYVNDLLKKSHGDFRWKVITLVRDPIARQISNFFENIDTFMPEVLLQSDKNTPAKICRILHDTLKDFDESDDYVCNWFDQEMNPTFDFNIFNHHFQPEKGFGTYQSVSADILVMRLEDLNRIAKNAVAGFLGLSKFTLVTRNRAEDKKIHKLYQEVRSRLKLPIEIVERIYSSCFTRFFYTRPEIERFKLKWSHRRSTDVLALQNLDIAETQTKKIMIIHPEGNLNNNPNLTGIIQILCENGYEVDYYALKKQVPQDTPCQGVKMFLKDPQGRTELDGLVILDQADMQTSGKGAERACRALPRYDLIIGIDRGIIEAEILADFQQVPYGLISYEIFFRAETGTQFKNAEIQACRNLAFAVCQDNLRARNLIQENRISPKRIITLPMGGRGAFAPAKNDYLHTKLQIATQKKIALAIGSLTKWNMIEYMLASLSCWPDDWVLVLHGRYGILSDELRIFERCRDMPNLFFSMQPANSLSALRRIVQSADVGLAFYRPIGNSPYTGDNIRHIGMASGKIATYLQSGLPVIINEIGEMSHHVRQSGLGRVVDVSARFCPAIEPDELSAMGRSCHRFYQRHLDLNHTVGPLMQRIGSLTGTNPAIDDPISVLQRSKTAQAPILSPPRAGAKGLELLPKISIVTPSMNQAPYLEQCILSILDQDYPNLEYIVMDGGSTDGSREIVERYAQRLAYWQSEPDKGHYHAIQEGFRRCTGDILTWLNADDLFDPRTFRIVASIFSQRPEIEWLTGRRASMDAGGRMHINARLPLWSRKKYLQNGYHDPFIQQEGTFWRRSLWQRAGAKLDTRFALAGDLELWVRFFRHAQLYSVDYGLAFYRVHGENRAIKFMDRYMQEAEKVIERELGLLQNEKTVVPAEAPLPVSKKQIAEYQVITEPIVNTVQVDPSSKSWNAATHIDRAVLPRDEMSSDAIARDTRGGRKPAVTSRLVKINDRAIDEFLSSAQGKADTIGHGSITFILPTKSRATGFKKTLACLSDAMQDIAYEIILYADKPSEDIESCIERYHIEKVFYDHEIFDDKESFSWSKLMNHGFLHASGDWVMFGSDDIVLYPYCFKNALALLQRRQHEPVGGISFLHRNIAETYDGFFSDFGYDTLNGDKPYINFGLINAQAYAKTCGFDEKFSFFWADVDICAQIKSRGYTIISSLGSFVDHNNVLEKKCKDKRIALFERDTQYFYDKWHGTELFADQSPLDKVRYFINESARRKINDHLTGNEKLRSGLRGHKEIKVVIDGVIFQLQATKTRGISRVWRNLVSELVRQVPEANITILQRKGSCIPVNGAQIRTVPAFRLNEIDTFDEDDEMLRSVCHIIGADLFISTYYTRAPGVLNVVMVHDLIPERLGFDLSQPEWIAKQRAIETADAFICVSRTTQKDLAAIYPQIANRPMLVAHNGLDTCFRIPSKDDVIQIRRNLKIDAPYVMLVGNRYGYKNGIELLKTLSELDANEKPTVLCVGGEPPFSSVEKRLQEKLDIRYAGQLNDHALAAAYGGAAALLVPSKYEGFGLPVIEAMACGCPVIAHASPAVSEIGGDAVCYTDLCSALSTSKALKKIFQKSQREGYVQKGQSRAAKYNWHATSQSIWEFIKTLIDRKSILLTAVVSTYNSAEFIYGCLEDLHNQSMADHLEIIVVDSASEQDEAAIVRDFQGRYPNIKYIRTALRENVYQAWNRGIKFALGKYVTNANTDDRHRRDAFEQMVGILEVKDKIALVYADVIKTRTANQTFNNCTPTGMYRWPDWDRQALLTNGCFIGPQPVWRKKIHETYGYFDESYDVSSDFEFWLRISQTNDFVHISKPLGLYLERPDSIEHAQATKKIQEDQKILAIYRDAAKNRKLIGWNAKQAMPVTGFQARQPHSTQKMTADLIGRAAINATGSQQGENIMNQPDTILKAVQCLTDGGQKEAARWVLDKLLMELPEHAHLHAQAGAMAFDMGEMDAAMKHFEQAAALSPGNAAYQKSLGDFYYVIEKDAKKALMQYEKVLAMEPRDIETLVMAGHVAISQHRYQDAQVYYDRVLVLDPGNSEIREIVNKLGNQSASHQANPLTADEIHASAAAKASAGDRPGAIKLLEQLLGCDCDQALIHNDLGVLYYECGKMDEACNHYETAAALQPENEIFQKNLADFYWVAMQDHQKALEVYVQVLKLDPQDIDALLGCGQICLALDRKSDARDFFETVLEIEPWNQDAQQLHGQLEAICEKATLPEGDSDLFQQSHTKDTKSKIGKSIDDLKQKLVQSPQNAQLHNDLGVLYYETGDKVKALASYRQAVQLEPNEPTYQKNLADFYLIVQGRAEEAMKLYLQVLTQDPEDVEALNATGMICTALGKVKDARYFYQRVLEIQPWDENAAKALKNLTEDTVENCFENKNAFAAG